MGPAVTGILAYSALPLLGFAAPGGALVLVAVVAFQGGAAVVAGTLDARRQRDAQTEHEMRATAARRAAAEDNERARARLVATAAHEIRTPLNGVAAILEGGLAVPGLPRDARDSMEKAVEAVRDLGQLLRDLVEMPDGEHMPLLARPFRIEAAVQDVVQLLHARAAGAGIALTAAVAPGTSPAWRGDVQRLRQILVQLVANGLRATERGEVRLDVRETPAGALELRVSDTGRGMAPGRLEHLFEPLGGPEGGSSLGLAVCRDLARRMGGDIAVQTAPGKGTVFTVTLPLAKASLVDADAAASIARPPPPRRVTAAAGRAPVLVVDDVAVNRRLLATVLARAGFAYEEAADGETALALLAARDFSAVLMDIEMPGMDGMETTRRLRAMPGPAAALPVIAVTAHRSVDGEARARDAGMNHYLVKPVAAAELAAALAETDAPGTATG